ncbi:nose resistant to fluoxetine protein 6-like [Armigeres subalbatus]|uniref:nose resistant to fluoxetine protein 6-like n=1 Tax=Armigeres subalbatus TaxID=124917 RepID=UPI002ED49161
MISIMDIRISLIILVITQLWSPVRGFFVDYNMTEYWKMPALFQYESIESCLRSSPDGLFCVVKSVVKSDERSDTWRSIKKYSKYPYQFQHAVLTRGICVDQCEQLVKSFTEQQQRQYLQPKTDVDFRYIINSWLLPNISHYRQQYGTLVNMCLNYRLQSTHNLTAYSEIEHCTTNATLVRKSDFWDVLFYATIALLFALSAGSSIYDWKLAKRDDHNHYRTPLINRGSNLLTAFSWRRNINRLTIKLNTSQIQQDLRFLEAIRVYTMTTISFTHVMIGVAMTTIQNPEMIEKLLSRPGFQIFLSLMPFEVDFFFAISGLLLAVQIGKMTQTKRFSWRPFWMGVVNRYLRSLPVYAVLMLFEVSVYDKLQVSPSGYRIMPMARRMCREKWWSNFLFINNYYRPEEQCMIHTWYLAADFQMFFVGFLVLMLLWKFQNIERFLIYVILMIATFLPMANIYYHSLDGMMLLTNKGNEYQLWYDKWFTRTYQATESHCISYFAGMLIGIIYHKMQNDDLFLAKSKLFKTLKYSTIPLGVIFSLPAPVFHQYEFSKPSLWMAAYAGVHRLVMASCIGIIFLVLMFSDRDTLIGRLRASKLLENAFYRVLGRLNFGFYLIHMGVLKAVFSNYHEGQRTSGVMVINVFSSVTMITYVLALIAYLLIEKPCDIIFKQLFERNETTRQEKGVNAPPALERSPCQVVNIEIRRRTSMSTNGESK